MKAMVGRKNNCISAIPPLKNLHDAHTPSTHEKSYFFLDLYGSSIDHSQYDAILKPIITSRIADRQPNDLTALHPTPSNAIRSNAFTETPSTNWCSPSANQQASTKSTTIC
jgi:hypothetical protein